MNLALLLSALSKLWDSESLIFTGVSRSLRASLRPSDSTEKMIFPVNASQNRRKSANGSLVLCLALISGRGATLILILPAFSSIVSGEKCVCGNVFNKPNSWSFLSHNSSGGNSGRNGSIFLDHNGLQHRQETYQ